MDAGAHGVIVPMVKSREDVEQAVGGVKYPPNGSRSIGLARAQGYGASFDDYFDWQQDNSIVVVQIEHIDAVRKLPEILSVPGVDAYITGPYDLSGSLGMPGCFDAPEFLDALMDLVLNMANPTLRTPTVMPEDQTHETRTTSRLAASRQPHRACPRRRD